MDQNLSPEKEAQATVEQIIPQQKKPGRKALQIFAIVVLIALVAGGMYAWQNNRVAELQNQVTELKKETAAEEPADVDPYADWKTYTTKYEKVTFKYPASLTLKYTSTPGDVQQLTPGTEAVTLTSKSGLSLKIWNGVDGIGGSCSECKVVRNDEVAFLGSTSYLNYIDRSNTGLVQSVELATEKDDYMSGVYKSKNITINQTGGPTINLYSIFYGNDGTATAKPLATFVADPALADMKLVLESMKY